MTETCATCQWWRNPARDPGWGSCEMADSAADGESVNAATRASAIALGCDEEAGLAASLVTRHDFGCNQWQAKGGE